MVPDKEFLWQDPIPKASHDLITPEQVQELKDKILGSGLAPAALIRAAWASASTFRTTDMRGGANGGRIALQPQDGWAVNDPEELKGVLSKLGKIQKRFNRRAKAKQVSLADLVVLGGAAAIEQAASKADLKLEVSFTPGRTDATQDQTDINSFAVLEPTADGFRNYFAAGNARSPAEMLVDKAALLGLTVPEMAVLVAGMRSLNANSGGAAHGVFTDNPGALSNDFFVNLIDMSTVWAPSDEAGIYEGRDRTSGELRWTATPVDLVFGSNSELRAISEYYAADDGEAAFLADFVAAWTKVMGLDRFDL